MGTMPEKESFKQWSHLKDAYFPFVTNNEIELLIGIDNNQAFTSLDSPTGPQNAPDALMMLLARELYGLILCHITKPLNMRQLWSTLAVLL